MISLLLFHAGPSLCSSLTVKKSSSCCQFVTHVRFLTTPAPTPLHARHSGRAPLPCELAPPSLSIQLESWPGVSSLEFQLCNLIPSPPLPSPRFQACSCAILPLQTMLEVLLALLGHGSPADCAAGPMALGLLPIRWTAPWEREYTRCAKPPPSLFRA